MIRSSFCRLFALSIAMLVAQEAASDGQSLMQFDVPATLAAHICPIESCQPDAPNDQTVELTIPVSSWMSSQQRDQILEFRVDVRWLTQQYPLVDFEPRTLMQSGVSGLISMEATQEDGGRLQTGYALPIAPATVQGQFEVTGKQQTTSRMSLVPRHDLLVTSGTLDRGSGAFFRFHASPQVALEGDRPLYLSYRVPLDWRGGLLQVNCRTEGVRKSMFGSSETLQDTTSFLIPVYLASDQESRQIADRYAAAERALQDAWDAYRRQRQHSAARGAWPQTQLADNLDIRSIERWMKGAGGSDQGASFESLPSELHERVRQVAQARRELLDIGR